ncbi:hypothetical protein FUA48_06655 [Flavobacterium alkalisoli]|uniref:DUF5050 domain-containing protein n=1 Tax=Flavobacterium alkalisoli TaxID=2602769 RepID=A0A5B9FSS9_9FLAO|nr:hypothetical protein [Flavobacterium alkalisoli]QEE49269.1 hypothetical protein FUA48_06655 [Flavobacterium alkalisoli]
MKKALLSFTLLFCAFISAQELTIPVKFLSSTKNTTERYIGTDAFGWEYTITDNEFRKQNDQKRLNYKSLSLGDIYRVDLQNPLQIVLFYKSFNTVVLLDNQLTETARFNFSDISQPIIAEAAGLASQNRLWLYDINTQQIGLYDTSQNSFKTITPQLNDGMKYYQSDYNYFYWINNSNKCYRVNLFGKVNPLGTVEDFDQLQFTAPTTVLFSKDNTLYLYNTETQSRKVVEIKEKSFKSFYYKEQILSIFTDNDITQYKITATE